MFSSPLHKYGYYFLQEGMGEVVLNVSASQALPSDSVRQAAELGRAILSRGPAADMEGALLRLHMLVHQVQRFSGCAGEGTGLICAPGVRSVPTSGATYSVIGPDSGACMAASVDLLFCNILFSLFWQPSPQGPGSSCIMTPFVSLGLLADSFDSRQEARLKTCVCF